MVRGATNVAGNACPRTERAGQVNDGGAMRNAILICALVLGYPALATADIVNFFEAVICEHPAAPQDVNNLPTRPEDVAMERYRPFFETRDSPLSVHLSGTGLLVTPANNAYDIRAAGNSDYTHLRASILSQFDEYQAYNYFPGYYQDSEGQPVQIPIDVQGQFARMETGAGEAVRVTGATGTVQLTLQFDLQGSQQNDWLGSEVPPAFASDGSLFLATSITPEVPFDQAVYQFRGKMAALTRRFC